MPLNDTVLNIGVTAMQNAITHASLHSTNPGASGTSGVTTAARRPITWVTPVAGGDMVATADLEFTGGSPSGAVTHIGLWSAATGGTFYGSLPLTGDQTFNAEGEYTVTGISIPGTAS